MAARRSTRTQSPRFSPKSRSKRPSPSWRSMPATATPGAKPDKSPVCDADEYAEAIILERLAERLPRFPVLAEEAAAHGKKTVGRARRSSSSTLSTARANFSNHNGEFTINIGLIVDGAPLAGVVYAPALGRLWIGGATATSCTVAPGEPCRRVRSAAKSMCGRRRRRV